MKNVVLLELNEIALPYVERYASRGLLPNFRKLLERHGYVETVAEPEHENLEASIQWVTLRSGLTLGEHGILRLGDGVDSDVRQVFEIVEEKGLKVGAVSPMNAANRLRNPAFFVPDPWSEGTVSGPGNLQRLYAAISQAVNDNAQARITSKSVLWLLAGFLGYARMSNLPAYLQYTLRGRSIP